MNKLKEFVKHQRKLAHKKIRSAQMFGDHPNIKEAMEDEASTVLHCLDLLPQLLNALRITKPKFKHLDYDTIAVDPIAFRVLFELDCDLQRRKSHYDKEFTEGDCYIYAHHMGIKMSNHPGDYISLATIIPVEVFYNKWN